MSEIQENTEAKLAAYIDGELEGAERAEIEKLLEQNPNYRRVLDQLQITRDMLRSLPRESAPADMCESFSGQLERSVLLEGLSENRPRGLSINRWPQLVALAAILLLTVGLASLFYFVLPKGNPGLVADNRKPPSGPAEPKRETGAAFDEVEKSDAPDGQRRGTVAGNLRESVTAAPSAAGAMGGGGGGFGGRRGPDEAAAVALATQPALLNTPEALAIDIYRNEQLQSQLNSAVANNVNKDAASDQAVVMVVQTNNPQEVSRDLKAYFADNSIKFESASPQVQLAANSAALNYRDRESQVRAAVAEQARQRRGGMPQVAAPMLQRNAEEQARNGQQPQQQIDNSLPIENVYIARGITRSQATALRTSIGAANVSGQNDGRNYAMTQNAANDNAPAVANTGQQIALNQQNQQAQNSARSFRQEYSVLVNRSDYSSNDLAKAKGPEANRDQPLGQFAAPSSQPADLKDANLQAGARAAAAPAQSQPARAARQVGQSELTAQKSLESATDKLAPATRPSDEPVDVVIIVQRAAAPATQPAATQPATQPADGPQVIR